MATVTKQQIADFVAANLGDPQAIASAAAQYGVSASDIADAMGTDVATVNNYFSNAGITFPATPAANTATTPTPLNVTSEGASGSVYQNIINAIQAGGVTVGTQNVPVPNTGRTQTQTVLLDASGNVVPGSESASITPGDNGQITIQAGAGTTGAYNINTQVDASGKIAPVTDNSQVTYQAASSGGLLGEIGSSIGNINAQTLLQAGLAYALPIAGQAIAASLGTSASIGTAIAATAAGVAQGQDPLTAAKNALPSLIAANIVSTDTAKDFLDSVSNNATTQQAISNAATSAIKTAAAGGTAADIFNNMASTVAGTELGSATGSAALGQGVASTLAAGNVGAGLVSSAGVLGSQQADANAKAAKAAAATTPTPVAADTTSTTTDPVKTAYDYAISQGKSPIEASLFAQAYASGDVGTLQTTAFKDLTSNFQATQPTPTPTSTSTPVTSQTTAGGFTGGAAGYYQQQYDQLTSTGMSPEDAARNAAILTSQAVASNEAGEGGWIDPITGVTHLVVVVPRYQDTSPTVETPLGGTAVGGDTTDLSNISVDKTTTPPSTKPITPTGALSTTPTDTAAKPSGVTTVPDGLTATLPNVAVSVPSTTLQDVSVTGKKDTTPAVSTDEEPIKLDKVNVTGSLPNLGDVVVTGTKTDDTSTTPTPAAPTDETPVTVSTSYVKPKTTSVLPSLVGQFSSPLTASPSAFTPAGSIPGQETGKEREDVWNVESLREGLGI